MCDLETSRMRRPYDPHWVAVPQEKKEKLLLLLLLLLLVVVVVVVVVVVGKMMVLTSNGVRATPYFKKISQMVQGCSGRDKNIRRQRGDLTSPLFFMELNCFKNHRRNWMEVLET